MKKTKIPRYILRKSTDNESILSLEFIKSDYLISGNIKGEINLWDLEIMRCIKTFNINPKYSIIKTNFINHNNYLYIQNRKGDIYYTDSIENFNNFEKLNLLGTNYCLAKFITITNEEKLLIPAENKIYLINSNLNNDINKEKCYFEFKINNYDKLTEIETINDYSFICGFESGNISIWDIRNNKSNVLIKNVSCNIPILSIKRAHNRIWISTFDSKIRVFNRNNFDKSIKTFEKEFIMDKIAISSDSLITVISNSNNDILEVFENKTIESIETFNSNLNEINSICFSKNSNLLATSNSTIAIWDLYN